MISSASKTILGALKIIPAVLAGFCVLPHLLLAEPAWKELRGDHFIVYYVENDSFARDILDKAERYYDQIADDLGYPRYSNFWQWDKRVKLYVYATQDAFHQATGQPAWSHGMADYDDKVISSYNFSENFLDGLLPHEITHLIFRDFVGFKGEVPLWLDEGVAQWEEPAKRAASKTIARTLIRSGDALSLGRLTTVDIRDSQDKEDVDHFYMQAVSVVDFMIRKFGPQAFTGFCRALRDGKSIEEALRSAYPGRVQDLADLENQWKKEAGNG